MPDFIIANILVMCFIFPYQWEENSFVHFCTGCGLEIKHKTPYSHLYFYYGFINSALLFNGSLLKMRDYQRGRNDISTFSGIFYKFS